MLRVTVSSTMLHGEYASYSHGHRPCRCYIRELVCSSMQTNKPLPRTMIGLELEYAIPSSSSTHCWLRFLFQYDIASVDISYALRCVLFLQGYKCGTFADVVWTTSLHARADRLLSAIFRRANCSCNVDSVATGPVSITRGMLA